MFRSAFRFKSFARALALGAAVGCSAAPAAVFAAPMTYTFTTTGPATLGISAPGGTIDASAITVLNALNANPLVTGSFIYDSSGAFIGNNSNGSTSFGGYRTLSGSGTGFSFTDPGGFITVANNTLSGGRDQIQLFADSALKSSSSFNNFSAFDINGVAIVNLRFNWIGNFLDSQTLPGTLPAFSGVLSFDIVAAPGSTSGLISDEFVSLNVNVAAVPEPQTWALMLAGLMLMGGVMRRRTDRG